jgi:uncharacterized membrane protein YecN with MAPEG domain
MDRQRWTRERDLFLLSAVGLLAAYGVWYAMVQTIPADPATTQSQRLAVAFAALLPSVALLEVMIVVQMRARAATGAIDPTEGRDSRFLRTNQRVITNTVEQLVCFIPALLALAGRIGSERMGEVVALALVFALARLAFWLGYLTGPILRAPGMAASFGVNVVTLVAAAWAWLG